MRASDRARRRARTAVPWAALALGASACSFDFDRVWIDTPVPHDARRDLRGSDFLARWDAGSTPDGAPVDRGVAPAIDGSPAQPRVCLWSEEGSKKAACPAGWTAIAGGGDCYPSALKSTFPSGDTWRVECQGNGSPAFTDVVCATGGAWRRVSAKGGTGVVVAAGCGAGEVLLGAGCECSSGMLPALHRTDRAAGGDRWECVCGDFLPVADTTAYAVCAATATAQALGVSVTDRRDSLGPDEVLPCRSGSILAGGCGTGLLLGSFADLDRNRWFCSFAEGAEDGTMSATCVTSGVALCPKP